MDHKILKALKEKADYVSGEELSEELGVSRTAVWKHIQELRKKGFEIESRSKRGYILRKEPELLLRSKIEEQLGTSDVRWDITILESVDSTNNEMKKLAANEMKKLASANEKAGAVLFAEEQTAGRGRLGRAWTSPKGKGLWMSILFRPENLAPQDGSKLTVVAAAAVAKAIENVTGVTVGIKWPNDIVADGKKLCGILTEMSADPDQIHWLVLGIGINVNLAETDFPEELRGLGTSLLMEKGTYGEEPLLTIDRNRLAAEILKELEFFGRHFLRTGELEEVLPYYEEKALIKDRKLTIHQKSGIETGTGVGISTEGHLLVRLEDGTIKEYLSGEVSVRGIYGYV